MATSSQTRALNKAADVAVAALKAKLQEINDATSKHLVVGVLGPLAEAMHKQADPSEPAVTVAQVAAKNHFGAPGVPARPFITIALRRKQAPITKVVDAALKAVTEGRSSGERALELVGLFVQGQIQETISEGVAPPNSPQTIARKGSSKPLIDTGQLRQSITYAVREGK